ncbi:MAG: hypothetical protein AB4038_04710 [Prochloraceae cyanobacterium]
MFRCFGTKVYWLRSPIYHGDKLITPEMIEQTYHCPIDLIAHGIPHRVLREHNCSQEISEHG